ncbi:hypothetical protein [Rhodococcus opacus]|uniref:hypothetical protein n=1 Tax=Rhodococcus opacus TaxID=37919 RepID=UPI00247386B6|nr:hypothetical protein [Rhodococcus opacus]MDH6291934.1 transposase-like protein [Rhodococcus opacus]
MLVDDYTKDAYTLHAQGKSWSEVARELGCTAAAAESFARAYQRRTDAAAAEHQTALF